MAHPFSVAPKDYNLTILKAVEPFLRIHQQPSDLRNSGLDKFEGGKIKAETMDSFLHLIGRRVSEIERKYAEQRTELNLHSMDLELVGLIEPFTTPTEQEFVSLKDCYLQQVSEDNEQSGFSLQDGGDFNYASDGCDSCEVDATHEEEVSEAIKLRSPSPPSEDGDDKAGMKMDTEHPPQGPDNIRNRGRTDGRVLLHDKNPLRRPELSPLVKSELLTQRCAVVKEFTYAEDPDGIMQAAAYARPEILRNLSNKHYEPMCLLVFSKFKYTYGFIKYEGKIRASGRSVSDAAYEMFSETCKDPKKHTSKQDLDEIYKTRLQHLRSVYKPNACYMARDYIVGDLYLAPEWYALPTMKFQSGMVSAGARKFYEGLLRVVIGDVVRKWDLIDLYAARARREVQSLCQSGVAGLDVRKMVRLEMILNATASGFFLTDATEENEGPSKRLKIQ